MSITLACIGRGAGDTRGTGTRAQPLKTTLPEQPQLPIPSLGVEGRWGEGAPKKKKNIQMLLSFFPNQAIPGLRLLQLHFPLNRLVFPAVEPSPSTLASGAMTDWFPLAARGSTMERL